MSLASAKISLNASAPQHKGSAAPAEFQFLMYFIAAMVALTTLPYLTAYLHRSPDKVFSGTLDHSLDTNNYLAYIRESSAGQWLFDNPMTGEPHRPVFFNLEWLLIGKVGSLLHLSPAAAMNFCRVIFLALMCFAVYWLASFLFESPPMRGIALVTCMAGGGFGWIVVVHSLHISLDSSYFLDLTNANLFPFYWALRLPHFLIAETFVVLGLCLLLRGELHGNISNYLGAGVCYMAAGACRPYDMLFLIAATGLFLVLSLFHPRKPKSSIIVRALPILVSAPLLGYYYWIFKLHPIFRWWSLPGQSAPAAWLLVLGFGASCLLLPIAAWRLLREGISNSGLLLFSCLLTAVVFAHMHSLLHFSFQFATNILIPMVMLVLLGLKKPIMNVWSAVPWGRTTISIIVLLNSLTSIALAGQAVLLAAHGEYDYDSRVLAAFSWIDHHSQSRSVVLADFDVANHMPQYTHNHVFCGYINCVNADEKLKALHDFLNPQTANENLQTANEFREKLLRENHIDLVLLTTSEADTLPSFVQAPFVHEVFRNDAAVIFLRQ